MKCTFVSVACLFAAFGTLDGCSGAGNAVSTALPPGSPAAGLAPAAHAAPLPAGRSRQNLLFTAGLGNAVGYFSANINEKNPPLLGQITSGVTRAEGLLVDAHGTLYLSNDTWPASIVEYKRGSKTPFFTITKGLYVPGSLAVDAYDNLYVADSQSGGVVLVYPPGASSPSKTISIPTQRGGPQGLAFDPHGNLLVSTFDIEHETGNVYSIAPGSTQPTNLNLQDLPGGALGADKSANIYVGGSGGTIAVFAPGGTTPSRWITAAESGGFYSDFAVTANGTIYWPNYDNDTMYEFAPGASTSTNAFYPGGGTDAAVGAW